VHGYVNRLRPSIHLLVRRRRALSSKEGTVTKQPPPARSEPPTRWLTIREAAERARLSDRKIRRMITDGHLPAYRPRGVRAVRLDIADVDQVVLGGGPLHRRAVEAEADS
jgi:excisionase family DNA binding protein